MWLHSTLALSYIFNVLVHATDLGWTDSISNPVLGFEKGGGVVNPSSVI